jgi:hypothetical protein
MVCPPGGSAAYGDAIRRRVYRWMTATFQTPAVMVMPAAVGFEKVAVNWSSAEIQHGPTPISPFGVCTDSKMSSALMPVTVNASVATVSAATRAGLRVSEYSAILMGVDVLSFDALSNFV